MPVNRRVFLQFVGDENAHTVTFHGLNGGARRLPVIAPQMGGHTRCKFSVHLFGNKVKLFHSIVHAVRQGPTIERNHRLIIRPAGWKQRWLHVWRFHQSCLRKRHRHSFSPGSGTCKNSTSTDDASTINHDCFSKIS